MKIPRVTESNGRYYYILDLEERAASGRPKQKWIPLSRIDAGLEALTAELKVNGLAGDEPPKRLGTMPAHLKDFRTVMLAGLTHLVKKEYERMYDFIETEFEEFNSANVDPGTVERFLNQHFSAKLNTRQKYKARLSTFFSWCCRNSYTGVTVNPCREIRLSGPPKKRSKLNAAIYWQLHGALTPMGQCFLELMLLCLQRPTEVRLLKESMINPDYAPGCIHFMPTKTEDSSGEEVFVFITPAIQACLDRARALRPKKKVELLDRHRDPFIIQTRDGDGYTKNGLYEVWRDAVDQVGEIAKGINTRHVRPFAGKVAKQQGYTIEDLQLAYAHTDITTTQGYVNQHRERLSVVHMKLPERG